LFWTQKIRKQQKVSAFGKTIFCAEENGKSVFFVAKEWGLGKYHIFLFKDKTNEKLKMNIKGTTVIHQIAVLIDRVNDSIKIYGKYVSPRDMNGLVSDSIYKYLKEEIDENKHIFFFTNSGKDEQRLIVKNPVGMERSDNYIIIAKAEYVRWETDYYNQSKVLPYIAEYSIEKNLVKQKISIDGKFIEESFINLL